jgi:hypothetical protein
LEFGGIRGHQNFEVWWGEDINRALDLLECMDQQSFEFGGIKRSTEL